MIFLETREKTRKRAEELLQCRFSVVSDLFRADTYWIPPKGDAEGGEEMAAKDDDSLDFEMEKPATDGSGDGAEAVPAYENPDQILSMNEQAKAILERARDKGVEHTFMFTTTFTRYVELISHLVHLQESIKEMGCLVEKEYVKGRKNIYVNPAINAYNTTAAQANNTATILMKFIVQPLRDEEADGGDAFDLF